MGRRKLTFPFYIAMMGMSSHPQPNQPWNGNYNSYSYSVFLYLPWKTYLCNIVY